MNRERALKFLATERRRKLRQPAVCLKCGHEWMTLSKKPRCRWCGSARMVKMSAGVPEWLSTQTTGVEGGRRLARKGRNTGIA